MGKSNNDNIVYAIAWICKLVIVIGCLLGFIMCVSPKESFDPATACAFIFAAVFFCNIFVWIARDPTLDD